MNLTFLSTFSGPTAQRNSSADVRLVGVFTFMILLLAWSPPAWPAQASDCPADGASTASISFTLIGDHIYVEANVNGTGPYRFIVDTGGVNLIDASLVKPLSLTITGRETGHGVGAEPVETATTTIDRLKLGDSTFRNQNFYTFDFKQLYGSGGVEMMGMLGAPLFRTYVTCIDFGHRMIHLIHPSRFDPNRAGAPMPMSVRDSVVAVPGSFDGLPGTFQIDTGSPTTLSLYAPFVAQHKLLQRFPHHAESLNSGVGGSMPAYSVRGKDLVLGTAHIDHPITSLAVGSTGQFARADLSGNVGVGALKRYVVTLDFPHERMFLKACLPTPTDLDTYDRSGLGLEVTPAGFRIVSVVKGAPASEAGFRPGDVIVSVDGKTASSLTLPAMRDTLKQRPAGSIITLGVKSDEKLQSVRLKLRDLL